MVYVLVRHNDRFEKAAVLIAGTFDLGLVGYWALPTAPPWWAARRIRTRCGG